ncbi:hypothetical protein B0H10DRAFT_1960533 [Mycena sp. CBHHK59/15]|nr:hypothetical protein B0H10DRAFT_1960533 [Mycena sp. CBHHK59/15]
MVFFPPVSIFGSRPNGEKRAQGQYIVRGRMGRTRTCTTAFNMKDQPMHQGSIRALHKFARHRRPAWFGARLKYRREQSKHPLHLFHKCSSWVGKRSYIRVSQDEVVFPLHDVGGFSHPGRLKMERAESVQVAWRVLDTEDGMGMKTASRRSRGSRADRIATRHPRRGGAVSEARRPVGMGRGGRRCRRGRDDG